ncbi:hypothetical protein JGH11_18555 [Dysgonomonas sp. Marseille-P4677]|uniref:hypothetical protein n=1 Tax=Dysgonomonas sp. Marseille-P4677 TaxID=2364790 RepID=UPI0019133742|nr:hypothetical protein [Dysgonomonas sp. Marseille-P4677]MBK5722874.1 hypothetical protein [Dysgonomonas sp. Marseille-P4677]
MKYIRSILSIIIAVLFSNCSVYENIYFSENGNIKYEMSIDAGEMIATMSSMEINAPDNIPSDTIIHLIDFIKDSLDLSSENIQDAIKNIEPIYLKYENKINESKLNISIFGNFENSDALNKAFAAMSLLDQYTNKGKDNDENQNSLPVEKLFRCSLLWDDVTMKRVIDPTNNNESDKESSPNSKHNTLYKFFANGGMVVKYHFPKKIIKVSNPDATLSLDGKVAIIEYSGSMLTEPTDKLSIEIATEK